jgi:PAS domain S-box-containing protein
LSGLFALKVEQDVRRDEPRRVVWVISTWVCWTHTQATIVYASESVVEILGYEPHEVVGQSAHLICHPDEVAALAEVAR